MTVDTRPYMDGKPLKNKLVAYPAIVAFLVIIGEFF